MASLLEQLSSMTVVVADTGDLEAIKTFTPRDATTNPSLILAAAQIPAYQNLIDETLKASRALIGPTAPAEQVVAEALDEICVTFGKEILKIVPGRVSTGSDRPPAKTETQSTPPGAAGRKEGDLKVLLPSAASMHGTGAPARTST